MVLNAEIGKTIDTKEYKTKINLKDKAIIHLIRIKEYLKEK